MKRVLLAVALSCSLTALAQTRTVITPAGDVTFKIHKGKYVLELANIQSPGSDSLISPLKSIFARKGMIVGKTKLEDVRLLSIYEEASRKDIYASFDSMRTSDLITSVGGVLEHPDGTEQGVTNRINCKLKTTTTKEAFRDLLKRYKIDTVIQSTDPDRQSNYMIIVAKDNDKDALDVANALNRTGLFLYADVDWIRFEKTHAIISPPNHQWGIKNDGTVSGSLANADMKVTSAWKIATGKNVRVAVLDDGVDLDHPDLKANLVPGYDATDASKNGRCDPGDAHGTACAGIIAAGNNNIGGVGVAYNAKIIPVRIGYGDQGHGRITMRDAQIAAGIRWAATKGQADILSCSWSGGSSTGAIQEELLDAMLPKPYRRGILVVFSAGNENARFIPFPAMLPGVIAVGASTMCDTRKRSLRDPSMVSCDQEGQWGSNYGPDLCVIAPGVKILTTDISGPSGFSTNDYLDTFGGTSAACPNVAGVLALILEAKPSLTAAQAKKILEATADPVGGYAYLNDQLHQTKKWCPDAGYGRVNAEAAVLATISPAPSLAKKRR